MMRKLVTTIATGFTLLLVLGLTGWNTMEGMGEDMQDAGEAIEGEAE
jgi:predicted small secreted protein